ncbi:hypothetical protein [Ralstonia sp. UBA689]|uniref:hypothetical protein n=1 Tax=Ralstonia sp. UBA689 TaxID=1947373 RepID=UPI0025D7E83B|nr:hypothetical protein [Ralstonia sp. UBA689]
MNVLDHEPQGWYLLKDEWGLYLDVNCNHSFAGYSFMMRLDFDEATKYLRQGRRYLNQLAQAVQKSAPGISGSQSPYKDRMAPSDVNARANDAIRQWQAANAQPANEAAEPAQANGDEMPAVLTAAPDKRPQSSIGALTITLWLLSIGFYVASLTQTALSTYSFPMSGFFVLTLGWISAFDRVNFAWLANFAFVICLIEIPSRNPADWRFAARASIAAVLLSLDTVRFTATMIDESGQLATIRGYGWGAALWIMALCLAMAAIGSRYSDAPEKDIDGTFDGALLRPIGLALFVVVVAASAYWSKQVPHEYTPGGERIVFVREHY